MRTRAEVIRLQVATGALGDVETAMQAVRTLNPPLADLMAAVVVAWKDSLGDLEHVTEAEAQRWGEVCRVAARIARPPG